MYLFCKPGSTAIINDNDDDDDDEAIQWCQI